MKNIYLVSNSIKGVICVADNLHEAVSIVLSKDINYEVLKVEDFIAINEVFIYDEDSKVTDTVHLFKALIDYSSQDLDGNIEMSSIIVHLLASDILTASKELTNYLSDLDPSTKARISELSIQPYEVINNVNVS